MALAVPVPQAAAILMPLLFVMDVQGVAAFRRDFDKKLLLFMLPCGLVGILVGYLLFKVLDAKLVAALVGAITLLFLVARLAFPPRVGGRSIPRWLGAILTATSGFTSFVAHVGGPPIQAYVVPMKLAPVVFTATMSYFFFVINLSKWLPYALLGLLDLRNAATSLVLLPLAPVGVTIGIKVARIINPQLFYRLVYIGMALTGFKLVFDGLRP